MHRGIRTLLAIRHGTFRDGYQSLDVLGWEDIRLIARAVRETAPRNKVAIMHSPGPIATVTARRIGYLSHLPTKMLPHLLGRDGRPRSTSTFRRLCDKLAVESDKPHIIIVTNGKLLRQFAIQFGIQPCSTERKLQIQRGGMVGIARYSGARVALSKPPADTEYGIMRDALQSFWSELC